ncbi:MAG: DUF454 domain-containing protein [Rhizobiaceae bacterium]|nr:MAG: DUF454 domain-containing protein [Rhizobiaceae bacterium]
MRPLWFAFGSVSLGLGILGIFLPLLPTTPFVLASAFFFSRSSPAVHDWLLAHRTFGPAIRDWREHRAISRRGKTAAALAMGAALGVSFATGIGWAVIAIQVVVMAGALTFVLTRATAD